MCRRLLTVPKLTIAVLVGLLALAPSCPLRRRPAPEPPTRRRSRERRRRTSSSSRSSRTRCSASPSGGRRATTPTTANAPSRSARASNSSRRRASRTSSRTWSRGLATKNPNSGDFNTLLGKDAKLIAALQEILAVLETEDETERIRRQIKEIKEAIKAIKEVKRDQEITRARTENPKSDTNKISKQQGDLAKDTQDIANKLGGKDNKGNPNARRPARTTSPSRSPRASRASPRPRPSPTRKENKSDRQAHRRRGSRWRHEARRQPGGMDASARQALRRRQWRGDPKPAASRSRWTP